MGRPQNVNLITIRKIGSQENFSIFPDVYIKHWIIKTTKNLTQLILALLFSGTSKPTYNHKVTSSLGTLFANCDDCNKSLEGNPRLTNIILQYFFRTYKVFFNQQTSKYGQSRTSVSGDLIQQQLQRNCIESVKSFDLKYT